LIIREIMIYTVTFSPAIDYVVEVDDFSLGEIHRSKSEVYLAGGKGINVSTVLKNLGVDNVALGFIAGFTGEFIRSELVSREIKNDFIWVDGNTRINVKIRSKAESAINGYGPNVTNEHVDKLIEKLKAIKNGSTLVISGSLPKSLSSDTYKYVMSCLVGKKLNVIVDCTGDALLKTLKYHPFMIKPNLEELEELFNTSITNDNDLELYSRKLIEMGAENVVVSLGAEGAFMVGKNLDACKIEAPKGNVVNTVGAGDSLVAGFIYAYELTNDLKTALRIGVVCGSASAFSEGLATKEQVNKLLNKM